MLFKLFRLNGTTLQRHHQKIKTLHTKVSLIYFFGTYDKYFPKVEIKIKAKTIQNPWITKGITKSSKKKQKLYETFLKKRTPQNEQKYKNYNFFKTIKKKAKKIYYSNKLLKCTGDIKKHRML